ncbi:MAG TPA: sigma-70 family RNA polymerase sigma factor [Flexivirga sp.]|uniref:RNA polymerase sigma factor n=1 Tax=Flexivirga sp. TaxID=1962927 RepID=UPI002BC20EBC|nr:sigma-70 family RNA polymerase sigma factor [Flexivirga sp.]HWC24234.1 sigma-70 family RNA polymerase sigma factor [Flexivirga sp.]
MSDDVAAIFRSEYGRAVSVLTGVLGDIDLAEDAVQQAFEIAIRQWPEKGTPPSPAGWIITTARRRAIDHLRREANRAGKESSAAQLAEQQRPERWDEEVRTVVDDRLRMLFTCCHPALAPAAQTALTLRILGGLTTSEIARAFVAPEPTIAQRIVRAKAKIRDARIPYRVPVDAELPDRLDGVLRVIYLVFNEGHLSTGGAEPVRDDLAAEAIRLARLLRELMPDEPEVTGLLALLLLTQARRPARLDAYGELVPLDEQDRRLWDRGLIAEGHDLVRTCLRRNRPGAYQLQAAIAAVHTDAPSFGDTDWGQIVALHDQLAAIDPSPVAAVNRAIAIGERDGAPAGLQALDRIAGDRTLRRYPVLHAARARLLARVGRGDEAAAAYEQAIGLTDNAAERRALQRQRALGSS